MKPEAATAVARSFTALWEGEFPATVRVIAAVPDAQREYRPAPKQRSAWELATHIAIADIWFMDSILKGQFAWDVEGAKRAEAQFQSVADVVAFYEQAFPAKLAELRALSGEELTQVVDFFGMFQMPRAQWIGFANNHCIHHRGQLSTYLRPMGAKVPDIYGPSGDAEPQVPA